MKHRRFTSIRTQMVAVFTICSLAVSVAIAAICVRFLYDNMESQASTALATVAGRINNETRLMFEDAQRLLQWGDVTTVTDFFYAQGERHPQASAIVAAFVDMRSSKMIADSVSNIYLLDTDGYGYNERTGFLRTEKNERALQISRDLTADGQTLLYTDAQSGDSTIVIGTSIRQPATRLVLGYIAVELRTDSLTDILDNAALGESGVYFIMDQTGKPIFGANEDCTAIAQQLMRSGVPTDAEVITRAIADDLAVCSFMEDIGWYVVGFAPRAELMRGFYTVLLWLILLMVCVLLLAVTAYFFISKRLTRPISRLKDHMLDAAGGNLDAVIAPVSQNEFAVLENQYNRMLKDIKALMAHNREEQSKLQKAELRALQAQINPHFLYNTLDSIIWMIAANDNEKAIEMIDQLSVFFRIGLSKGVDWISVREDIEHLSSYLYIQRVRYSDRLDFSIDVDERIMNCVMLKMTLQPIAENAIYHGIKNKKEGGSLTVTGCMEESGCLVFRIRDTGVGMTPEECARVQEQLARRDEGMIEQPEGGFGLYNVDRRIKLYCGADYGLSIESVKGEGTTVTVRMQAREAGERRV